MQIGWAARGAGFRCDIQPRICGFSCRHAGVVSALILAVVIQTIDFGRTLFRTIANRLRIGETALNIVPDEIARLALRETLAIGHAIVAGKAKLTLARAL